MEARFELSTRPDHKLGSDEEWDFTEAALAAALERRGLPYELNEGDGAFYGPKIDLHMTDVLGRSWQMGTIQLDSQMPQRFGLTYVGADNAEHTPYVVHRALLGSLERFIGILIEHTGGDLPLWLAPVQVRVLPVSDQHVEAAARSWTGCATPGSASSSTTATSRSARRSATPSCRRCRASSSTARASRRSRSPSALRGGEQQTQSLSELVLELTRCPLAVRRRIRALTRPRSSSSWASRIAVRASGRVHGEGTAVKTYVIIRRNGWRTGADLEEAAGRSSDVGDNEMSDDIRWIRSYVLAEEAGGARDGLHLPGVEPGEDPRARRARRPAGRRDRRGRGHRHRRGRIPAADAVA